jgi:Predicted transcriptional regulators
MCLAKPYFKTARIQAGYTQTKLAYILDCPASYINMIEFGKQRLNITLATTLCDLLSVKLEDTFTLIPLPISKKVEKNKSKNLLSYPDNLFKAIGVPKEEATVKTLEQLEYCLTPTQLIVIRAIYKLTLRPKEISMIRNTTIDNISSVKRNSIKKMQKRFLHFDEDIREMKLSTRTYTVLHKAGIKNINQLLTAIEYNRLIQINNCSENTMSEILKALDTYYHNKKELA